MAFIHSEQEFNPDQLANPIIGIASSLGIHDSGSHSHQRHQLLFAQAGCMSIELDHRICLLPPSRAAWIPPGVLHRVLMTSVVEYRSIYFSPSPNLPNDVQIFEVNPLLRELIERISYWPWNKPIKEQANTLALFLDELNAAAQENWQLRMPKHPRLQNWLIQIKTGVILPAQLNLFANQIGMSTKTVSRIFKSETGMSYQAWRQQWRLIRAMELLADARQVSKVADQLEFSSDSAFISFFKQHTGHTPLHFLNAKDKIMK
ncbi:transcriptional regulator AraC/XylS family protein [Vibrio cholerae]|uniref:AraC family transcriptional regulator n=1 Tax=Vibrio cholerae TaxID=666 RepID=UPI0011DABB53|nr:helix-turn-helix transcriptional regulator [Vibrio cholerae]EJL6325728.1 helix-turn-helix transcriptional regulator [Vibrio cholerae]EJL6681030.1 helix-turn-helix transcriptional regulator [Vibrio cholerae]EJL6770073.1 helix-turn-helix transcriptional regulator [Vibrio cholerae]ELL3752065.1 helix-turn-helix transcriptional regulator [Vibrio cholerae]MDH7613266.1 helix-turn-helix transcriptional regulator [Vibrio cholerae]